MKDLVVQLSEYCHGLIAQVDKTDRVCSGAGAIGKGSFKAQQAYPHQTIRLPDNQPCQLCQALAKIRHLLPAAELAAPNNTAIKTALELMKLDPLANPFAHKQEI